MGVGDSHGSSVEEEASFPDVALQGVVVLGDPGARGEEVRQAEGQVGGGGVGELGFAGDPVDPAAEPR